MTNLIRAVTDYVVVQDYLPTLITKVNALIANGWEPLGGVTASAGVIEHYAQALVKPSGMTIDAPGSSFTLQIETGAAPAPEGEGGGGGDKQEGE